MAQGVPERGHPRWGRTIGARDQGKRLTNDEGSKCERNHRSGGDGHLDFGQSSVSKDLDEVNPAEQQVHGEES